MMRARQGSADPKEKQSIRLVNGVSLAECDNLAVPL